MFELHKTVLHTFGDFGMGAYRASYNRLNTCTVLS